MESNINNEGFSAYFDQRKAQIDIKKIRNKQKDLERVLESLNEFKEVSKSSLKTSPQNRKLLSLAIEIANIDWERYSQKKNNSQKEKYDFGVIICDSITKV